MKFGDYAYNFGAITYLTAVCPLLAARMVRGDKYRYTLTRRLGIKLPALPSFDRPPLWFHAVSVGEVATAATIIDALEDKKPGLNFVISVATRDGLDEARRRFGPRAEMGVMVAPVDLPWAVGHLIDTVRPCIFALVETDVWPNMLIRLMRRGVPAILLNGRLSAGSGRQWRRFGGFSRRVWGCFEACLMQSGQDAARVRSIGVEDGRVLNAGNVKYDRVRAPDVDVAAMRSELGLDPEAPVFVAGSTHRGEERIVLEAFGRLLKISPRTRLILAPRQPERFDEAAGLIERAGYVLCRRSIGRADPDAQVILLDTLGELDRVYGLSRAAFVGGSLIVEHGVGGHNLLEPAAHGIPVLFGPNMKNFRQMSDEFVAAGAGFQIKDAGEMALALEWLWSQPDETRTMGGAAVALVERHRGATDKAVACLLELLPRGL